MPQTLAQLIRSKHAGAYDDLSDAELESSVKARFPGVYDDLPTSSLPTRPVSAEDFLEPEPSTSDKVLGAIKGFGRMTIGAIPEALRAIVDVQRGVLGGDLEAMERTGARLKGAIGAQGAELGKAQRALVEGRLSEAGGHALAGVTPLVGPAAASAGEKIGAGDPEGLGEAVGLLASATAPRTLPVVARGANAAARGAVGAAGKVSPLALSVAEHVPVIGGPIRAVRKVVSLADTLNDVLSNQAETPTPTPNPNAGGRVVPSQAPTVEQAVSDVLAELSVPEPPRRITTPPPAGLPPGYTPRTTVPRPKPAKASLPASEAPVEAPAPTVEAPRKRAYFLRDIPAKVADEPIVPSDITDLSQLPTSWRPRTGQPLPASRQTRTVASRKAQTVTAAEVDEIANGLVSEGLSPSDAMKAVMKNRQLAPEMRTQLMTALGKLKKRAG